MNILKQRWAAAARALTMALLAGGLGLTALSARAEDDPPGRVGRLAEMRGQVWFLEEGQGEWQAATINRPVTTADRIATDNGARVELQIGSTTVRLDQASDLEVNRLDDDRVELTLHGGAASLRVREPEVAREVQISTAEGRFSPRGPGLFRIDHGDRGATGGATQGEIDFESVDSQLTLRPGQRAEFWIDPNDRRTHYNWSGMPNDEFEQWVRSDEARDQRYASGPRRPISPEMTGAEDLEGNGAWDTHPEYGAVWYPTTVVAGWAPYRYGHWAWVRPWGWTWVDDASWGFAPFHYGRWVNWRGRWCWAPGTYVRRPVYAPAMVAWVGGPHVNVSVSIGGGGPVGWVPLAPREVYYPAYRTSPVYIKQVNVTHVTINEKIIVKPTRPVMYANSRVNGGVTVVNSDVLTRRQAVASAARPADDAVIRNVRDRGVVVASAAPPTPANASFAPRQVRQPGRDADIPPPRSAQPANRAAGNDNERSARGGADRQPPEIGRGANRPPEPAATRRPQAGGREDGREATGRDNPRDNARDNARDNPRDSARDNLRDRQRDAQDAPRVARPPLSNAPAREPNQVGRDATAGVPQPRRETNDAPNRVSPREQRDQRDLGQQQRESPRQPAPQQAVPQHQPAPRPVPQREDRPEPQRVERPQQPERQVERQPQQERPQVDRQERRERQEQRHERRDDKRDKRDGPNA